MSITFELPADLEDDLRRQFGDLNESAKEALLIRAYVTGRISIGRLAMVLGVGVMAADQWLAERNVPLNYGIEDFDQDAATIEALRRESRQ